MPIFGCCQFHCKIKLRKKLNKDKTKKILIDRDVRLKDKPFRKSKMLMKTEKQVKKTIKSYNNNFGNILQQLNTSWVTSDVENVMKV